MKHAQKRLIKLQERIKTESANVTTTSLDKYMYDLYKQLHPNNIGVPKQKSKERRRDIGNTKKKLIVIDYSKNHPANIIKRLKHKRKKTLITFTLILTRQGKIERNVSSRVFPP